MSNHIKAPHEEMPLDRLIAAAQWSNDDMSVRQVKVEDLKWAVRELTKHAVAAARLRLDDLQILTPEGKFTLMQHCLQDVHASCIGGNLTADGANKLVERIADVLTVVNFQMPD